MTPKPVAFQVLARRHITEITRHYDTVGGSRLATRFAAALQQALDFIARHPLAGRPEPQVIRGDEGHRSWHVRGFPYRVFYLDAPRLVRVTLVLHVRRNLAALR